MTLAQAMRDGVENFSLLAAHVLVPPAIEALLSAPDNRVQGFLAAGHVCTVMGYWQYEPIAARYGVPIVVAGFEPVDLLQGIYLCIKQLEAGVAEVENPYHRMVRRDGNSTAQSLMRQVFAVRTRRWRGMGAIAESGLDVAPDTRASMPAADLVMRWTRLNVHRMPVGRGAARPSQARRMSCVWYAMYAGTAARGDNGLVGGCLCGLLSVSPSGPCC